MNNDQIMNWVVNTLIVAMVASVPALIFAAFWFNDGSLLWWLALPVIFFMTG